MVIYNGLKSKDREIERRKLKEKNWIDLLRYDPSAVHISTYYSNFKFLL